MVWLNLKSFDINSKLLSYFMDGCFKVCLHRTN